MWLSKHILQTLMFCSVLCGLAPGISLANCRGGAAAQVGCAMVGNSARREVPQIVPKNVAPPTIAAPPSVMRPAVKAMQRLEPRQAPRLTGKARSVGQGTAFGKPMRPRRAEPERINSRIPNAPPTPIAKQTSSMGQGLAKRELGAASEEVKRKLVPGLDFRRRDRLLAIRKKIEAAKAANRAAEIKQSKTLSSGRDSKGATSPAPTATKSKDQGGLAGTPPVRRHFGTANTGKSPPPGSGTGGNNSGGGGGRSGGDGDDPWRKNQLTPKFNKVANPKSPPSGGGTGTNNGGAPPAGNTTPPQTPSAPAPD